MTDDARLRVKSAPAPINDCGGQEPLGPVSVAEGPMVTTNEKPYQCCRKGCAGRAEVVAGIEFWPHKALMDHYQTYVPLAAVVLGLPVCRACVAKLTPEGIFKDPGAIQSIIKRVEQNSSIAVDPQGTKVIAIELNDPRVLHMARQLEAAAPIQFNGPGDAAG